MSERISLLYYSESAVWKSDEKYDDSLHKTLHGSNSLSLLSHHMDFSIKKTTVQRFFIEHLLNAKHCAKKIGADQILPLTIPALLLLKIMAKQQRSFH